MSGIFEPAGLSHPFAGATLRKIMATMNAQTPIKEAPMSDSQGMAFVGTSSGGGGCPTIFVTERGTLVIQGTTVTDPVALDTMRARGNGMPDYESAVEIPAALLPFIDIEALQKIVFADEDRPEFVVDPASAEKLERLAAAVAR